MDRDNFAFTFTNTKKKIPIVSLEFFIDMILPVALWLWG